MPIIKKKSLIVALISSLVISSVLILTLISYVVYIELKAEEERRAYQALLYKINARIYSKDIEITNLSAKIGTSGPLSGKPIIEGVLRNKGIRPIVDIIAMVKFLDKDGVTVYDVIFHPQDPVLGASVLSRVPIPYLSFHDRPSIDPGKTLPFKVILTNCPKEILLALNDRTGYARNSGRWAGNLVFEAVSIEF